MYLETQEAKDLHAAGKLWVDFWHYAGGSHGLNARSIPMISGKLMDSAKGLSYQVALFTDNGYVPLCDIVKGHSRPEGMRGDLTNLKAYHDWARAILTPKSQAKLGKIYDLDGLDTVVAHYTQE